MCFIGDHRCDGVSRGDQGRVGDPVGPRIQESAENTWEGQHVVDLIRIVAAAGGNNRGVLGGDDGIDLRIGIGKGENDGVLGHCLDIFASDHVGLAQSDEDIRSLEGLGHRPVVLARVGDGGEGCSLLVHPIATGIQRTLGIEDDDVLDAGLHQESCHGDAAAPAPIMTTRMSDVFFSTRRSALCNAARTTTAVPC